MELINVFDKEKECNYRGEHYSVRNNGSVLRHPKIGNKPRPNDNVWTFGKVDVQHGYTKFGNETVHRIVATAFLGEPSSPQHVVDHIDTNRRNNRPENLRWVTKLENVMLNKITRNKLESICGCSIEEIVTNWEMLRSKNLPLNLGWMRAVSKEEAEKSLISIKQWADNLSPRSAEKTTINKSFVQNVVRNEMIYPLEPKEENVTLRSYSENFQSGLIFCSKIYQSERVNFRILDFYYNEKTKVLSVATQSSGSGVKSLYITTITCGNNQFLYSTRSFFSPVSIEKHMTLAKGEEWTGEDTIDDYC